MLVIYTRNVITGMKQNVWNVFEWKCCSAQIKNFIQIQFNFNGVFQNRWL